jgi:hypothetical protein
MKNSDPIRDLLLTIAVTALLVPGSALAGTAGALPFAAVGGVEQGAADNIAALMSSEMDIAGDWDLVVSANASEITDGCGEKQACWQAFGKGEGHTHVITGSVAPQGDKDYEVTARVLDVKSGAVVREVVKTVSRKPDLLLEQIPDFATQLATGEVPESQEKVAASKPKFEQPSFDEFEEEEVADEEDKPKWMNRDRRGRLIKSEDAAGDEDPFGDLGDEDLDLDELDSDTQRKKAEERREKEAKEAARQAEAEAERARVEEARQRREEEERRRAEEDRLRREEERRQAEAERRRRDEEERAALAERERRDELRRLAAEREAEEEAKRRAEAESRRQDEERRAAREREDEDRRVAAARAAERDREKADAARREEEARRAEADRRREDDRRRAEAPPREERRSNDRRREPPPEVEEVSLVSAIEAEDDGFVIEDDDPGFVIEEDEEDEPELREGHIITYGEDEEEEAAPVSRRRDDYDPYARARGFEARDREAEAAPARREREAAPRERSYERIDRRDERPRPREERPAPREERVAARDEGDDDVLMEDDDILMEDEEGDFDRLEGGDERLAYNADGYPDRRRGYDDEEVRARPSGDRGDGDRRTRRDEPDDRYEADYRASRSARASATRSSPTDRQWVSVRLHGGYTNYYLHFGEFGLDLGVLVHPQVAIDVGVDFWAVGLTVLDEFTDEEVQQVHTLPNFSVGGSWRGDFNKVVRPFVGADFSSTIYATVRRGTPDGPTEPRASVGFLVKGGVDIMFLKNLGAHIGLKGGVMYAEEIAELVSAEWAPTQGVFNFNGGLSLRF